MYTPGGPGIPFCASSPGCPLAPSTPENEFITLKICNHYL